VTDFAALLQLLTRSGVEFILVGGAAATAHGLARLTQDLDVVVRCTLENLQRLFGVTVECLGLERLIHVKRAASRPKDLEVLAELQALLTRYR
jgi:predicted nucleotidyltransferase